MTKENFTAGATGHWCPLRNTESGVCNDPRYQGQDCETYLKYEEVEPGLWGVVDVPDDCPLRKGNLIVTLCKVEKAEDDRPS